MSKSVTSESAGETVDALRDLQFKLGLWLSGLESFLNLRSSTLVEESRNAHDWSKEFRLTHSVLLLCSKLSLEYANACGLAGGEDELDSVEANGAGPKTLGPSVDGILELSFALRESVLLSEGLLRAAPLNFGEWIAWSNSLADKLKNVSVIKKLIKNAESEGENFLPEGLERLLTRENLPSAWEADLKVVMPHFAKILRWLNVVGEMLREDKPLKTTLVLFARINEQMQEMTTYINNRLLRFSDEDDPLFGSLDGAAYTASIELRKVYQHELKGLAEIRPAPQIYAKIETAYSLLNDSLQLTLVNFARLIDSTIEPTEIFPNLQTKEEQSLVLRENMWNMLQSVKGAEQKPDDYPIDSLRDQMREFRDNNLYFLFYKDMETVDRFIEEVLVTDDKKDLVPILHRFGAYLETLLGLVNMRVVLADHP
ncbi:MAG: hypothetical protein OEQ28_13165, partial [Acidobacteriota bacterium]|nr:hypothetical protein [Acidobacteriota bacterium]